MTSRTAAKRYARALFDVTVKERGDLSVVEQQLGGFVELLARHDALRKLLVNPAVPTPRKRAAVAELTTKVALVPVVAKLLILLGERDRLSILDDLLAAFRERLLEHQNIVQVEVTTATPLAAEHREAIERSLSSVTRRTVSLKTKVDESIVGGMVARVGSTVYDGSLARHLTRLKQKLVENA